MTHSSYYDSVVRNIDKYFCNLWKLWKVELF